MQSPRLNQCGREIVRLRSAAGLSQEQLAAKCQRAGWDVSRDIVANIELGRRLLRAEELAIFAEALRARLIEFFPRKVRDRLSRLD